MPYSVKLLSPGDKSLLERVAAGTFDRPIDPSLVEEFLADSRHSLVVAIDDAVVVGFASAIHYVNPDKPCELWINEIGVAPTHREQGIGSAILQRMLERARELGCVQAWVLAEESNQAASRLYAANRGEFDGGRKVMYSFRLTLAPL